ncbi:hypothetical protein LXL04_012470 [Taraxacum kok-saghyz]
MVLIHTRSKLLLQELPSIFDGSARNNAQEQDDSKATLAPKISQEESWLTFDQEALILHNKVRAFAGWPGTRAKSIVIDEKNDKRSLGGPDGGKESGKCSFILERFERYNIKLVFLMCVPGHFCPLAVHGLFLPLFLVLIFGIGCWCCLEVGLLGFAAAFVFFFAGLGGCLAFRTILPFLVGCSMWLLLLELSDV